MPRAIVSKLNGDTYEVEIKDYKDYYKHLECDTFDVVMVKWYGHDVSIYLDDEGMMKTGNKGRMIRNYPNPLFGNFVIAGGVDAEGETLDLVKQMTVEAVKNVVTDALWEIE